MTLRVLTVVGARPQFIKAAANSREMLKHSGRIEEVMVHTGQHYDANMSDSFFNDLDLPQPHLFLGVGSGSHSVQTAKVMEGFERVLLAERPDVVIVVGDVNSTVACALVTKKTWCSGGPQRRDFIPELAHVEAGLLRQVLGEEAIRVLVHVLADDHRHRQGAAEATQEHVERV